MSVEKIWKPLPIFKTNSIIICKGLYNEDLVYVPAKYIIRFGFDKKTKQTFIYTLDNVRLLTRLQVEAVAAAVMEALND